MNLSQVEIEQFYKIWYTLIWSINEKHKIVPAFEKNVYGERINEKLFFTIRTQLWEQPHWIFVCLQSGELGELTESDCAILKSWRNNFIKDRFMVMKHLKTYSVFMSFEEPAKLYGVCGISNPIKEMAQYQVPYMVDAILLPFNDKIIYDSFINTYAVSFGKGMRENLKETYEQTKETIGIIETMGVPSSPVKTPKKKQPRPSMVASVVDTKGANVPKAMSARYMEIAEIIEKFCDEKLNAEYKDVCLQALAKLCRKRQSPVISGRARTWACGIVHAIGSANFLFDKSQPLNMAATDISDWFGISKSTSSGKAAEIKNMLNLSYFNAEFLLESNIDDNPAIWLLSVNGLPTDIRDMPLEAQKEAFRRGLIPYIPAYKK